MIESLSNDPFFQETVYDREHWEGQLQDARALLANGNLLPGAREELTRKSEVLEENIRKCRVFEDRIRKMERYVRYLEEKIMTLEIEDHFSNLEKQSRRATVNRRHSEPVLHPGEGFGESEEQSRC